MKLIKLNESQFNRLFEDNGDSPFLDGNDTTRRFGAETTTQAVITEPDGEEKISRPMNTRDFADKQSPQQWGSVGGRKSSNTI